MAGIEDSAESSGLLARLKSWCFPSGEEAARGVRGLRTTQRGEIRLSAGARWTPLTADEFVDATASAFRWQARIGSSLLTSVHVTDAYENGQGRLEVRKGPIRLKKLTGPEVDRGELQRYLGYVGYCPAMLLNNPGLEFSAVGASTLRVSDRQDRSGASVDIDIDPDGSPALIRAVRPMTVGNKIILTPWSAKGNDWRECEGIRIAHHLEAAWDLPPQQTKEAPFTYIRMELLSVTVLR